MKTIKHRPRLDKVDFEARATGFSFGRTVYLLMLFGLFGFLLNYFFGQTLFFRAHGMVMQERHVVDAFHNSHLAEVYVKEGDVIHKEMPLVRINSTDVVGEIAKLSASHAEIATKLAGLKNRETTLKILIPLAKVQLKNAQKVKAGLQKLKNKRLINNQRLASNIDTIFNAQARVETLQAEFDGLATEMELVSEAEANAKKSVNDLIKTYDNGFIRSKVDGRVGPRVASQGDVKLAGEKIMALYSGDPFILTFMPHSYLFDIKEGMIVKLKSGNREMRGKISKLLPVADALPSEFQNLFKPTERTRLARVELEDDIPFALLEKINISGCDLFTCGEAGNDWAIQAAMLDAKDWSVTKSNQGIQLAQSFWHNELTPLWKEHADPLIEKVSFASQKFIKNLDFNEIEEPVEAP